LSTKVPVLQVVKRKTAASKSLRYRALVRRRPLLLSLSGVSNSVSHAVLLNERQSRQPFLFYNTLSLQGDPVDGILLNVLVELLATHKLLHTSLAQSVGI
jgi:hypothetical protein